MAYGVVSAGLRAALGGLAEKRQLEAISEDWRNEAARLQQTLLRAKRQELSPRA